MGQMEALFLTKKTDSANANHETWKLMAETPSDYSGLGLKSDRVLLAADDTELFALGAALDSDTKIQTYADRLLVLTKEYAVWRASRLQTFRDDKAAL